MGIGSRCARLGDCRLGRREASITRPGFFGMFLVWNPGPECLCMEGVGIVVLASGTVRCC